MRLRYNQPRYRTWQRVEGRVEEGEGAGNRRVFWNILGLNSCCRQCVQYRCVGLLWLVPAVDIGVGGPRSGALSTDRCGLALELVQ